MLVVNQAQAAAAAWNPTPATRSPLRESPSVASLPAGRPTSRRPFGVLVEREWQQPLYDWDDTPSKLIVVGRWKEDNDGVRQHSRAADPRFATVAVNLRATCGRLEVDGRRVHDGKIPSGMAIMTGAGLNSRVEFGAACDVVHLFVPRERLQEIMSDTSDQRAIRPARPVCISSADPVIERLAWLLLKAHDYDACSADFYLDGIAAAIVARLIDSSRAEDSPSGRQGLLKWRLKRVEELVEAQLSEPLSLRDLAECAGLSRMHFAAQFRAATGLRPHEYLVRRRIERAQEMLRATSVPLVEVALSVGFQTQAHFTTVFRRLLGETPGRWRQAQRFC